MRREPAGGKISLLERINRCPNCGREVRRSAISHAENPFCSVCLPERIRRARGSGQLTWRRVGSYVQAIPVPGTPESGGRRHRSS
jgi:hypothetical protein